VKIVWEKTRFLSIVEGVVEAAGRLIEELGVEKPEPTRFEPLDPSWGVEAARRVAEDAVGLVPPYSREAMILFAASAPAPLGHLEALGASRGELEELGCSVSAKVYGHEAPGMSGSVRLLCSPGGVLEGYRCLAAGAMRLLQLEELRRFVEAPSPLEELVREAMGEASREKLEQIAAAAKGEGQKLLVPRGCVVEPPTLPLGYWSYRLRIRLVDVEAVAEDGGHLGTYMDLVEALSPLFYRGLAGVKPAGDELLEAWLVAPPARLEARRGPLGGCAECCNSRGGGVEKSFSKLLLRLAMQPRETLYAERYSVEAPL
jgi:hypothetical protein